MNRYLEIERSLSVHTKGLIRKVAMSSAECRNKLTNKSNVRLEARLNEFNKGITND